MYHIIESFRAFLIDFFRDNDNAFGSPIPPKYKNDKHQVSAALYCIAHFLCMDNVDFEKELRRYPLHKDVEDLNTILEYVLDNYQEKWGLYAFKFFKDFPLESHLEDIHTTIEKVIKSWQ